MSKILLAPLYGALVLLFCLLSGVFVACFFPPIAAAIVVISLLCGWVFASVIAAFIAIATCLCICGARLLYTIGKAEEAREEYEDDGYWLPVR